MTTTDTTETRDRYDPVALAFHWAMAALIIGGWVIIQVAEEMAKGPDRVWTVGLHKSVGVTVLALLVLRVTWRRFSPPPALPSSMPGWMVLAAKGGHAVLYLLMLGVPVAGIVMSWTAGRPVAVWGLFTLPSLLGPDKALNGIVREGHELLGNLLLAVAALHAGVALFHQYVMKDGLMERMLPRRRATHTAEAPTAEAD
jgi:cytochrome b561